MMAENDDAWAAVEDWRSLVSSTVPEPGLPQRNSPERKR
jgi:hypothetical protein